VSKWRPFSFIFYQEIREKYGGWETTAMLFLVKKFPGEKKKYETVRCRVATASSFVARLRGEVFAHFDELSIKRHSSKWN
jgi:hypothetical protein